MTLRATSITSVKINTVPQFPLYDELLGISEKLKETINLSKMASMMNNLSIDKNKMVAGLIFHHAILNKKYEPGKLPYGCKIFDANTNSGLKCVVSDLPETLRKILYIYIGAHQVG